MFRRRWSGLPADPIFASDLKELGYFINDMNEIRSIEDPDYYFKYFLSKNDRWNERQRFAFNEAIQKEIHARLDAQNFTIIPLPLGTPPTKPHVPIRTSPNLPTATRVILLFGESSQALGVLAHRVIGGKGGGVTRGSVLGLIAALSAQRSSAADPSPPAIVLANAGELWWWPEGGRGLTPVARHGVPMASAVHLGRYHDAKVNEVPGNRTVREHVRGVFEVVVLGGGMVGKEAKVDVIALGDTADEVEGYLDDDKVWERVGRRLGCLVTLGSCYSSKEFKCEGFKRFMAERARAYMIHHTPLDTAVAGPGGNPGAAGFTSYGCPVYSAGEAQVIETMLIEAQPAVLSWMQQVALEGEAYKNAVVEVYGEEELGQRSSWWGVPENGNDENEAEAQKKDTEAADDEVKDGGEAQINQKDDNASGNTADAQGNNTETSNNNVHPNGNNAETNGSAVQVEGNDKASVDVVEADDGPNAQDMKELVKEIKDLKITN